MESLLGWLQPMVTLGTRETVTRLTVSRRPATVYVLTDRGRERLAALDNG
jgi:DNA-binding PadR family transcriptional regulator